MVLDKPRRGRPAPANAKRPVTLYWDVELHRRLKIFCVKRDTNMSEVVQELVRKHLDANESESEKPKKRPTKKKSDEGSGPV
ncbi:MAG: hypothetical protein HYV07_21515 [Deltaproteobacteria bacterium]|nr:hypothetical protein [Deltaproteobacteria bacterium]